MKHKCFPVLESVHQLSTKIFLAFIFTHCLEYSDFRKIHLCVNDYCILVVVECGGSIALVEYKRRVFSLIVDCFECSWEVGDVYFEHLVDI